jgi:prolyl-tRNA editing enzyme YbaK/EbsC (Cys-tRNA(Pro) deacylase)
MDKTGAKMPNLCPKWTGSLEWRAPIYPSVHVAIKALCGPKMLRDQVRGAGSVIDMAVDFSGFAGVLKSLGVTGEIRELPEPAPTAAAAARQLGCEVGAIANSLVFAADGAPLLVMTSGAHRVDTSRVASLVGASVVARADASSVRTWTGQAIGGVGPVAHPAPIRTLVDTWLAKYDVVWAAAGHPHTVFPTSFDELVRITAGTPADVGE